MIVEVTAAGLSKTVNVQNGTHDLGARHPGDISVEPIGAPGMPVLQEATVIFFHAVQLSIYRKAVEGGGDNMIPEQAMQSHFGQLVLQMVPLAGSRMTWADALFGLQKILQDMYLQTGGGFREQIWDVLRRARGATSMSRVGHILLRYGSPASPLATTSNSPSVTNFSASNPNSSSFSVRPLSAQFPVPETDMTLFVGSRGVDVQQSSAVRALDSMISRSYVRVANAHRVRPVERTTSKVEDYSGTLSVITMSRLRRGVWLFDDTDLVEMAVGVVFYMVNAGFFMTTITAVGPDHMGQSIPVGDMEIAMDWASIHPLRIGNTTVIDTS